MHCIIMEKTLIKLTHHNETKKRAHDSQIVRAEEKIKLSHGGSSYIKASKPYQKKRCFCFNPNQITTTKNVLLIFALILTKAQPKRVFSSILALILTKAHPKMVFISILSLF